MSSIIITNGHTWFKNLRVLVHEEDSEDDSSVVLSSRKQTTSNNDITKSAKRKLYNIDQVEDGKYGQKKKPVVVVEDCMSKVRTRQSSVVKSSNVNKIKPSSTRGGSTPSKRSSKKTVMSESDSDDESESDDESDSYTLWTPDGDTAVRRSERKRKFVKVSTYDGETSSDASDSVKSSSRSRRRQKRKSTSSDEEKLQRTPSSQHSSSNVTVKDKKQGSGHQGRLLPVNESIQGSGSEVSAAFRRVTLARHSPHEKKKIRYNEDDSENDSDPSESSKSLQHKSRVESCGDEGQSLNLQKSPKFYRGKEDSDSRKGCVNEVLATLRKNIAEKLESPTRHLSRIKETLKHTPSSRRNTSENSDSTIRRSARKHKRINYNLGKDENDSDSDDTTTSQDNQKRGHEFSSSDGGDEMAAISKKSSRPNSKDLIGREKSPRNKESNKKLKTKVSTPSRATTSNYSSPSRLSRRGRIKIGESDSSDSEDNAKNLRSPHDQNFDSTVRRSARENKSMNHNIDKGENVSDSDDTTTSDNNKKRGHEFSSSDGGDEMAAISKKASTRPNTKNLIGSEKSLKNKESDKKSKSGVSTPSKATTSNYDIPPGSSRHGKKTVKISKSDSSDSEDNTKNLKSPNSKLRLNNDSADNNTSPARQSTRKRKPNKRYVDDDKEGGSNSFSVVSSKSFRVPSAKGNENEELRGLRKIVGEKLLSLIQGSTCRKSNADTEGTKSPGNHKRKPAVSSSDDEERAGSRISQSKLQGTPSSKRELSEPSHNASPREKALRNKENCETTTYSRTPSKNYQSPVRHSTRERKPVNINESDPNDNENNTRVSQTKTQKTPDVKQGLNNDAVSGITPSSRSTRKRKPPKKYSDDDEEGNNSSSVVSPRRGQTPQTKRLQADVYASPARRSSQKQTPAKQTSDDSDADVLVSKTESPRTPRAGHLTPLNRKSLARRGLLTPTMPARDRTVSTPNTPQEEAMSRLHVSAVPKTLPCREKEFADIFRFIEGKILDKAGGCMYISGTPGTGKTATVREVMESLRQAVLRKDLPDFQFIEMNAMGLTEPRQAYVFILKALTGEKATAEQAQRTLEKMFTRSAKRKANKSIVLMVDELDILWTKREDVVYNLLDWPTKVGSRLIVLTIANTMDMPERMLKGRVTSRLGLTRLTFQPYTFRQLEQIVQSRLEGIQAFDADAVQLVARKVASVSGDARRALDICRRATELAELDGPDVLVSISHVDVAVREMLSSSKLQALRACSEVELLFLKAVMTEVERTGIEETRFFKVYKMLGALCVLDGLEVPNVSLAMKACNSLGSMRLLLTEHSRSDIQQRLLLNVNPEDVRYTLKEMGG
ncbi:origin recognition complex subunit 1-like [Anabrus simplex]|uniref:origin recognition complex subunit 1-like n=1 Tax=Anabrus simplex TaxID=316456 RepID=UPI0035A30696